MEKTLLILIFLSIITPSRLQAEDHNDRLPAQEVRRPVVESHNLSDLISELNSTIYRTRDRAQRTIESMIRKNCALFSEVERTMTDHSQPLETQRRLRSIVNRTRISWPAILEHIKRLIKQNDSTRESLRIANRVAHFMEADEAHFNGADNTIVGENQRRAIVEEVFKKAGLSLESNNGNNYIGRSKESKKYFSVFLVPQGSIDVAEVEPSGEEASLRIPLPEIMSLLNPTQLACAGASKSVPLKVLAPLVSLKVGSAAYGQFRTGTGSSVVNYLAGLFPAYSSEILQLKEGFLPNGNRNERSIPNQFDASEIYSN